MKLRFRQRGLNKGLRNRLLGLAGIFIAALIVFAVILNLDPKGATTTMEAPTLPVIYTESDQQELNPLYGYTVQMDAAYIRDNISPVSDKKIDFNIHTYGRKINAVNYEIHTMSSDELEDEGTLTLSGSGDSINASVRISEGLESGREYSMVLTADTDRGNIYYYTRIIIPEEYYEKECLAFAENFHNKALSDEYTELSAYMETDETKEKSSELYDVTLESSLSQVGYGDFDGTVTGDVQISYTDITADYTSLEFNYQMARENTSGETEIYDVSEYFRVRYTETRTYMMDYERTMEQVLEASQITADKNVLTLGITEPNMNYLSNELGTVAAFEMAGELYEYDQSTGGLTRIFSMRRSQDNSESVKASDITDQRSNLNRHDIKILNIDETGTMDFVVYGYMNAGTHEGECGINLYHYDSVSRVLEEKSFVRSTKSAQVLIAAFTDLLYMSTDGAFDIMMGGTLVEIDLSNLSTKEIMRGLGMDQYAASRSGRYLAYIDEEIMSDTITVLDLETMEEQTVEAPAGEKLRPVAFMDDDFVYGIVRESDVKTDAAGTNIYPMYQLNITDVTNDLAVLKTYTKDGSYIADAASDGSSLALDLYVFDGQIYVDSDDDTIRNSAGEANKTVTVASVSDEIKGRVVQMTMLAFANEDNYKKITEAATEILALDQNQEIEVQTSKEETQYFVYTGSRVLTATNNLSSAINTADSQMGVVVDNNQTYLWKRSRRLWYNPMSGLDPSDADAGASNAAKAVSALLAREGNTTAVGTKFAAGETPIRVMQKAMPDATVLDLTGSSLSQLLYYVSIGNPVYVALGDDDAVLITGYTATNVNIYYPATDSTASVTIEAAEASFAAAGRVYISYVD